MFTKQIKKAIATFIIAMVAVISATLQADDYKIDIQVDLSGVNNPNLKASDFKFLVKGNKIGNANDSFMKFNQDGTFNSIVDAKMGDKSEDFSISPTPVKNVITLKNVPQFSGRMYISIKYPMLLPVVTDKDSHIKVTDPAPGTDDSNYKTIYDKVELTFLETDANTKKATVWANTTAVDFISLPIGVQMYDSKGNSLSDMVGITTKRDDFNSKCLTAFSTGNMPDGSNAGTVSQEWKKCVITTPVGAKLAVLRLMAPHKVPGFDAKYLDDYISAIWTYYTKPTDPAVKCNQIAVDCSELLNDDKCSQKVALKHNKIFTGYVMPANTESTTSYWVFTNKTNEKDKDFTTLKMIGKDEKGNNVGKPSSNEIFGACDSGPFHGFNHTIESVIAKNFYSAIVSGILPLKDNTAVLSRYGYFAKHTKDLYKNNTVVPPTGNNLPWFMLYAAVLHDFGQKIYAYAYDDVLNIDSTLSAPSGSTVKCTMGDISGLVIPDNDHNKTSFKAIFHIPSVDALDIQHTDKKFYRWTSAGLIDKDKKVIAKAPLTLDAKINIKYGPVDAKGNIPDTVYALDLNNPGTCAAGGVVNSGTSADGVTSFDFPAK